MVLIDSAQVVSYSTSLGTIIFLSPFSQYLMCGFDDLEVCQFIIQTSTVQGHPGSKYIGPIESPLVGFYLTSFESNIVSVFIFETFDEKVL